MLTFPKNPFEKLTSMKTHLTVRPWTTFFAILLALFLSSQAAFAFQGEMGLDLSYTSNEPIHSDLYLLGWRVEVDQEVDGDLFVLGGTVRVHGPIHGNVFLAGGSLEIDGPVDGDINLLGFSAESDSSCRACRALALDINNEGKMGEDLLALGALLVDSKDKVGGDTLLWGGQLNLGGTYAKKVMAYGHDIDLAGTIKGNAEFKGDNIILDDASRIRGNLVYTSSRDLNSEAGRVIGTTTHNFPPPHLTGKFKFPWLYLLTRRVFSALWLTIVGLVSLHWFPRSSQTVVDTMLHFPWESFFLGLVLFIAIPGIAFVLLVSVLGIPLGIFLFAIFGIGIYLTRLFASLYIGERLLGALEHHMPPYWQSLPLGVFIFTLLTSIPYYIGFTVSIIVIPLALGAKALLGWRVYRRMRQRHMA